jgi:hypothetical protein
MSGARPARGEACPGAVGARTPKYCSGSAACIAWALKLGKDDCAMAGCSNACC